MSKAEILAELPALNRRDRAEIFDRLWSMEAAEPEPTASERALLDRELEEFGRDGNEGEAWPGVLAGLRQKT